MWLPSVPGQLLCPQTMNQRVGRVARHSWRFTEKRTNAHAPARGFTRHPVSNVSCSESFAESASLIIRNPSCACSMCTCGYGSFSRKNDSVSFGLQQEQLRSSRCFALRSSLRSRCSPSSYVEACVMSYVASLIAASTVPCERTGKRAYVVSTRLCAC